MLEQILDTEGELHLATDRRTHKVRRRNLTAISTLTSCLESGNDAIRNTVSNSPTKSRQLLFDSIRTGSYHSGSVQSERKTSLRSPSLPVRRNLLRTGKPSWPILWTLLDVATSLLHHDVRHTGNGYQEL